VGRTQLAHDCETQEPCEAADAKGNKGTVQGADDSGTPLRENTCSSRATRPISTVVPSEGKAVRTPRNPSDLSEIRRFRWKIGTEEGCVEGMRGVVNC